jgi:hypothetical protein
MKTCKCGNIIKNFYAKQCRKCYIKWSRISIHNPFYGQKHTLKTKKLISLHHANVRGKNSPSFGKKRPDLALRNKLNPLKGIKNPRFGNHDFAGKNNPNYGKRYDGTKIIHEHHIDLNHGNNKKSNKLYLFAPTHQKLHQRAYEYLVVKGLIRKYIKWFDNRYGLGAKKYA